MLQLSNFDCNLGWRVLVLAFAPAVHLQSSHRLIFVVICSKHDADILQVLD